MNSLALAGSVPFSLATRVTLYLMDFFVLLGGTGTLCDTDPFEQAILAGSPASGTFELKFTGRGVRNIGSDRDRATGIPNEHRGILRVARNGRFWRSGGGCCCPSRYFEREHTKR